MKWNVSGEALSVLRAPVLWAMHGKSSFKRKKKLDGLFVLWPTLFSELLICSDLSVSCCNPTPQLGQNKSWHKSSACLGVFHKRRSLEKGWPVHKHAPASPCHQGIGKQVSYASQNWLELQLQFPQKQTASTCSLQGAGSVK